MLEQGPRRLPLHQRPDAAAGQPRLHAGGDRRDGRASRGARPATGRCAATTARSTTTCKATYVKYLGWFDGNPANLHTLPPEEAAKRYVEFMGGADADPRQGARGLRRGRLPLGRRSRQPRRVRRPRQRGREAISGRHARAAGLPVRVRDRGATSTSPRAKELREGVTVSPDPEHGEPRHRQCDDARARSSTTSASGSTAPRPPSETSPLAYASRTSRRSGRCSCATAPSATARVLPITPTSLSR